MCLLVKQPSTTSFTDEFLMDVFTKNSDGLGVMYAEDGKLHVYKCLPATAQDFIDFYRKHVDGKDCVWHARMQTHGDIDFDNCHPYKVTDDIWLAHNGVLSTGNDADKTRSDTWHFIKNVIAPALSANPELMMDEDWQDFIGDLIGRSNKFGLMNNKGEIAIINEVSGVEFVGAWLSNTYAWSTHKFGFKSTYYNPTTVNSSGWSGGTYNYHGYYEDEDFDGYAKIGKSYPVSEVKSSVVEEPVELTADQVRPYVRACYNQFERKGVKGIMQWVNDAPQKACALLNYWYDDCDFVDELVYDDPEQAAEWLADLFTTDSVSPSLYQ
jgi:hypothetical protein